MTIKVKNTGTDRIAIGNFDEIMTFGDDGKEAESVQDEGIENMEGKVLPGKSRTGTYGWVVAKKDRKDVQLEFDWDGDANHEAAVFSGPLRA